MKRWLVMIKYSIKIMQGKAYVYVRSCSGDDKKIERQKKKCKIFIEKYMEGHDLT